MYVVSTRLYTTDIQLYIRRRRKHIVYFSRWKHVFDMLVLGRMELNALRLHPLRYSIKYLVGASEMSSCFSGDFAATRACKEREGVDRRLEKITSISTPRWSQRKASLFTGDHRSTSTMKSDRR